jgi:hypothetical protein
MTEFNYAAMAKELERLLDEEKYEAFLREQSLAKDHSFLLASVARSNLRPAVREVLGELIRGELRRPKRRPKSDNTDSKGLYRALRVWDLENQGWGGRSWGAQEKRSAAFKEAGKQLCCSHHTIEKAFYKYKPTLEGMTPAQLNEWRKLLSSVFKSKT